MSFEFEQQEGEHILEPSSTSTWKRVRLTVIGLFCLCVVSAGVLGYSNSPSPEFPSDTDISVQDGETISSVAYDFAQRSVVRSSFLLTLMLQYYFPHSYIQAGQYRFKFPLTTYQVAYAITHGEDRVPFETATFPEGFRTKDLSKYLPARFNGSDLHTAIPDEGFLFPDTYSISGTMDLSDLLTIMRKNFDTRTASLAPLFASSTLSKHDVVILASIVEREARNEADMKIVAGILLNRLKNNMPLQVDATFEYLFGKTSAELTSTDLATDSPYNTYRNKGLPPTPIANPGLIAIRAVLEPIQTPYLYYLTDKEGMFHYALTFEEHKRNKTKYLP